MENNNAMISFGDLMSILLACFMLVSALLATKVVQEHSTKVQLLEKKLSASTATDSPGESSLYLSLTADGHYVLEGKALAEKQDFTTEKPLLASLAKLRPVSLYVRGDRDVAYGKVLSVLFEGRELGIRTSLSAKKKNGG